MKTCITVVENPTPYTFKKFLYKFLSVWGLFLCFHKLFIKEVVYVTDYFCKGINKTQSELIHIHNERVMK